MPPAASFTSLERGRFSGAYAQRLRQGILHFKRWLPREKGHLLLHKRYQRQLDGFLASYVQWCFDSEVNMSIPKHAVLGYQHTFQCKRGFPRAWTCLLAWRHRLPSRHRTPIPFEVMQAMALMGLERWLLEPSDSLWLCFSIAIRFGFFGLLRPGEILRLRATDVMVRPCAADQLVAVMVLVSPKNKRSLGLQQFCTIRDQNTARWLQWVIESLHPEHKLWPSSGANFRKYFANALAALHLSDARLSPASLRAGAATHSYLAGMEIQRLQFHGRWASQSSLNCYIQEAMGHLVWMSMPEASRRIIRGLLVAGAVPWEHAPHITLRASALPLPRGWRRRPLASSSALLLTGTHYS